MTLTEFEKPRCFCGGPVHWFARWSDRELYVCDDDREEVWRSYDGDHDYDQTGLIWQDAKGNVTYEDR